MKRNYPYLKDIPFLDLIYGQHNQTVYTRITILDWAERPLENFEGRVLSASMSVNGDSAVRRTANLSVKILDNNELYNNVDSLISINKKIFIETGLKNNYAHLGEDYYPDYPTIWFPFGTFVITSCSVNHDSSGVTVSLTLSDKMCLLNGSAGGVIPASTNFESYDTLGPDGDLHTEYIRINQIIPELVNHFGGEDLNNIIVNDVPNRIKQVLRWIGRNPLYLYRNRSNVKNSFYTTIKSRGDIENYIRTTFTYGYDCGYTYTDFVYPGELGAGAGDSVCTVLDKIKQTLGNYEYYYDVFGTFIFQEIKNYVNTTEWRDAFNNYRPGSDIALPYAYNRTLNSYVYDFSKNDFVISYNNSPKYEMIKNDFVVWGEKKNDAGYKLPCRYHLAIDERPHLDSAWNVTETYTKGICFVRDVTDHTKRGLPINDTYDNLAQLKAALPEGIVGKYYLVLNEQAIYSWVTDIETYENAVNNYQSAAYPVSDSSTLGSTSTSTATPGYVKVTTSYRKGNDPFILAANTDWRNILYWQGTIAAATGTDSGYYFAELYNEWPKIYDVENGAYYQETLDNPSSLDWWLDIIDNDSELSKFSVKNIGRRSYAKTDSDCNCVFEADIPDIVMVCTLDTEQQIDIRSGLTAQELAELGLIPLNVDPPIVRSTAVGGTFNSCYEHVKQILNDYTNYNESISITCLPIYHLEPNTRVHLDDPESGIYGDYVINNISFSLGNTGNMSLSLQKVIEKI